MRHYRPIDGRPVNDPRAAYDVAALNWTKSARVLGVAAIITHDKIMPRRDLLGWHVAVGGLDQIRFSQCLTVDEDLAVVNFDRFAGQTDDAFDQIECAMSSEDDNVATFRRMQLIRNLVHDDAFTFMQSGQHADLLNLKAADEEVDGQKDDRRQQKSLDDTA